MGKTTVLYRLLEDLHDTARTVLVSQTQCNSRELIAYILHELGIESEGPWDSSPCTVSSTKFCLMS